MRRYQIIPEPWSPADRTTLAALEMRRIAGPVRDAGSASGRPAIA